MIKYIALKLFVFAGFICFIASAKAQKLTYKIIMNKNEIGTLYAERDAVKDNVHYLLKSKMTVDKVVTIDIDYRIESDFVNGKMTRSSVYQKINNRVQVSSTTQWDGSAYNIQAIDYNTILRNRSIVYNMCTMYYIEPVNITHVYSDAYGKFLKIRPMRNHRYELQLPDGKKNYYNYASGICFQVETEQMFSKIIFRLTR